MISNILEIGGIQGISTVDYPKEVASVVFFAGCPFRCPYCQNKSLAVKEGFRVVSIQDIMTEIEENKLLISGVCISGGEPFLQIDGLVELVKKIRDLGIFIKIDTNGFYPNNIVRIIKCIDFISLDIKAPPEKYGKAIGREKISSKAINNLKRSLKILQRSGINYEFRTTIVPGLNDSKKDIIQICKLIAPFIRDKNYILQQFRPDKGTLHPAYERVAPPSLDSLLKLKKVADKYLGNVIIRCKESMG